MLVARTALEGTLPIESGILTGHHDRTGNGVTPLNIALRAEEHFDAIQIPQRLRAIGLLVIGQGATIQRQIEARTGAAEEGVGAGVRAGTVDTAHGGQIVTDADIHDVGRHA